jgi:hypothetical protein
MLEQQAIAAFVPQLSAAPAAPIEEPPLPRPCSIIGERLGRLASNPAPSGMGFESSPLPVAHALPVLSDDHFHKGPTVCLDFMSFE